MNPETRNNKIKSYYLPSLFVIVLFSVAFYQTSQDQGILVEQQRPKIKQQEEGNAANESCNLFSGRWVFDNGSYPLYKEEDCSFMRNDRMDFTCHKYGRKDVGYQNWRWQPHDCDLPRFNATELLEKIRGKRVVFVGDSLGRNQWTSMLCLIESSLSQSPQRSFIRNGNLFIFHASEYDATIEFYWSPLLVESNCDDPFNHSIIQEHIIRVSSIEKHAMHWSDADILIFDAHMWWQINPTMILLWGSFGDSNAIYKRVKTIRPIEMTLNLLSDWLEININRTKTKLFFISLPPVHMDWKKQHCYNETEPVMKEGNWGSTIDPRVMRITESVVQKLGLRGLKIKYLNITYLSNYRKDGHPSLYRKSFLPLSYLEHLENPMKYLDCMHWCLPGVPDVWNELLYTHIVN